MRSKTCSIQQIFKYRNSPAQYYNSMVRASGLQSVFNIFWQSSTWHTVKITLKILTEKSCVLLISVQRMAGWLLLILFMCLHNQLSSLHSIITYYEYRCLRNAIHQIVSKNEWLLFSASFTAKFPLVFCINTGK